MIPTRQDLNALFSLYDVDGSGTLTYKEFAAALYARPMSQASGSANRGPEDLAEALKTKL